MAHPSSLARLGYVVMGQALVGAELAEAWRLVDDVLSESRDGGCDRENNVLVPLRWDDRLVDLCLSSASFVARVREACRATDLRWISGYVSVREPHTGALPWHQDWWCWDHPVSWDRGAPQVAVLCYLDGATAANAALRVLPGSHARWTDLHSTLDEAGVAAGTTSDGTVLEAAPGDAVVLDYRLLHGTTANAWPRPRHAVVLNFAPAWAHLPVEVRGHLASHLALPRLGEAPDRPWRSLLPAFDGPRHDLPLVRRPSRACALAGAPIEPAQVPTSAVTGRHTSVVVGVR